MRPRALIVDASLPVAQALRGFLSSEGWEARHATSDVEATAELAVELPDIIFASVSPQVDAERFCRDRKVMDPRTPIVLLYPPDASDVETRSAAAGAEACLVGPLKQANVISCARLLMALLQARIVNEAPAASGMLLGAMPSGTSELDFFHRLVDMEVRRSRRYRYPVGLAALGLDMPADPSQSGAPQDSLSQRARIALLGGVRDTDLVVEANSGHFLVLLPYTSVAATSTIAERLRGRLYGLHPTYTTASAGIVTLEPALAASQTGRSLLDAVVGMLAKAREDGGDRVVAAQLIDTKTPVTGNKA